MISMRPILVAAILLPISMPAIAASQAQDAGTCQSYGFKPRTDGFAQCMMQIDQQRQNDQKQRLRAFGMALGAFGAALSRPAPAPVYAPPRQLNCTTQAFGAMVHTNCY